ncbi:MAG TPA: VTT domain-containing protein [Phototrophicaceae bacterium]|nr:VTT domain-containing protein [Phototrophicaceae bacterium]
MDLTHLIVTAGYLGIFIVIFAESGLLIGFFLPGDSLLFTAGFLAFTGTFSLPELCIVCGVAAILGDSVGYMFGRRVGRRLFERENSTFFKKKYLISAEEFYEKQGSKAIVLARFIPIVRTFAPIVAGISNMHYRRFVTFNIIGGLLWACGVSIAGYLFGNLIPREDIDKYLLPIIFLIIVVSLLPSIIHVWRDEEMRTSLLSIPRNLMSRSQTTRLEVDQEASGE